MNPVSSPDEYRLREMTAQDLPEVMRIERVSHPIPWSEKIFTDCLKVGYLTLVVEAGQKLYGFVIFSSAAGESHILNICVDPDSRRNGVASVLMEQAVATAMLQGATTMFLEARVSNTGAITLYEKLGFIETGRRRNYYNVPGGDNRREDAVLMAKALLT